jgi:hypothetical protein
MFESFPFIFPFYKFTLSDSFVLNQLPIIFYIFKDVFLLDTKKSLFVWIGKGASEAERRNAMGYAHVSS